MHANRPGPALFGHGVAVFDLDRTLIPGSSFGMFGRALMRHGLVARREVARHAVLEATFRRRGLKTVRIEELVQDLLAVGAGADAEALVAVARSMGATLAARVPPTARLLLDLHQHAGHACVIVSASPHELVESIALALGVDHGIGTRVATEGGVLTGRLDGPFCYGAGKLVAIERELGGIDLSIATGYADSGSDAPLLERCGTAVAVNPDSDLRRLATGRGWPIIRFG